MSSYKCWRIQLGEEYWGRFTYARPAGDLLRLLGSIARGSQIGALGELAESGYVQVNGDHVAPLSASQVRHAVEAAKLATRRVRQHRGAPSQAVVVTVKRRRVAAPT